jgi:hypothetical protein
MVAVPELVPVTMPVLPTAATIVLLLVHEPPVGEPVSIVG